VTTLFWLVFGHALADFPLQGSFLSAAKRAGSGLPLAWPIALTLHAWIHGGVVALITGSMMLGLLELVLHWSIDYAKTRSIVGPTTDQAAHLACKAIWAVLA
jgi:hypothetical protein